MNIKQVMNSGPYLLLYPIITSPNNRIQYRIPSISLLYEKIAIIFIRVRIKYSRNLYSIICLDSIVLITKNAYIKYDPILTTVIDSSSKSLKIVLNSIRDDVYNKNLNISLDLEM